MSECNLLQLKCSLERLESGFSRPAGNDTIPLPLKSSSSSLVSLLKPRSAASLMLLRARFSSVRLVRFDSAEMVPSRVSLRLRQVSDCGKQKGAADLMGFLCK